MGHEGLTALFTDLDGTLLDSQGKISENNRRVVRAAVDENKHIVLCSGRSVRSMAQYEEFLGINASGHYSCAYNGSLVYTYGQDGKVILYKKLLDSELAQEIIATLKPITRAFSDMHILAYARVDE